MTPVEEMKAAALLTEHKDFMGICAGGMPLIAFEGGCRFCGATHAERCNRAEHEPENK